MFIIVERGVCDEIIGGCYIFEFESCFFMLVVNLIEQFQKIICGNIYQCVFFRVRM